MFYRATCSILLLGLATAVAAADETDNPTEQQEALRVASELHINVPVMCREWHVWWGSPHGVRPHIPTWNHWKGLKRYNTFNPETTIEETLPGSAWRRHLNCVGYPLLGPYCSNQQDIIRWQLETAHNAGLACLHVHLWPSIWDDGRDFTPLPIFDRILDQAEKLGVQVGFHDEIQFRRPNITKAQVLENSIKRTTLFLKQYASHPAFYRMDGLPFYYLQNWSNWISPEDMATYFTEVEKAAGPVYWVVEQGPKPEVLRIPQLKAYVGPSNSWFLHTPPHGVGPHPWDKLQEGMQRAEKAAREHGKKLGILVYTRFDHSNDRGKPGHGKIDAEGGMFYADSLRRAMAVKPDFVVVTQWNDFEECAFIEPGWDFDGFDGDPYFYCRLTAAAMGKAFTPAPLPSRAELDPFIRHKLFGNSKPGDMGPVVHQAALADRTISWAWAEGSADPKTVHIVQSELAHWRATDGNSGLLRLGNLSAEPAQKALEGKNELRFYAPGLVCENPVTCWIAVVARVPGGTRLRVDYKSNVENYRVDSRWDRRHIGSGNCARIDLEDGRRVYWQPIHGAAFAGVEGDLIVRLDGKRQPTHIEEILVWHPRMQGTGVPVSWDVSSAPLPEGTLADKPFILVASDALGNPGLPRLFWQGRTTRSGSPDENGE